MSTTPITGITGRGLTFTAPTLNITATPLTNINQVNLPNLNTNTNTGFNMDPLGLLGMGLSFFGGLSQASRSRQAQRDALSQQRRLEREITDLENTRQDVVNGIKKLEGKGRTLMPNRLMGMPYLTIC